MPEGYITWQEMGIDFLYHGTYKEGADPRSTEIRSNPP